MKHKIKKLLFDIKESIDSIESYLGDKRDFNLYQSNKMLRRAIEREFEIIGEAMSRIDKLDRLTEVTVKSGLKTTHLGIPCLTLRPNTERPVTITQGTNRLCTPAKFLRDIEFNWAIKNEKAYYFRQ